MLKIVCVEAGNYLGRGKEYVQILADMMARNVPEKTEYQFICFTDNEEDFGQSIIKKSLHGGLKGWWNKLYLFKEGTFEPDDRIIYFDLDTVITGPLDDIIKYKGQFAILRDFYRPKGMQSSVMAWRGDWGRHIWREFEKDKFPDMPGGDQAWIEYSVMRHDIWQDILPNQFVSYKVSASNGIPKGANVVIFHGLPRPHECFGWVEKFWRVGGAATLGGVVSNTEEENLIKNIEYSTGLDRKWLDQVSQHDGVALIIGGGPSLRQSLPEIKSRAEHGEKIFALNNSYQWLVKNGVQPHAHIMLDARPENIKFVPDMDCNLYYASQCDSAVWDTAKNAVLWNHINALKIVQDDHRANTYLSGGSTVGLNAMSLAYILGYRTIHLYGFDSSYDDERHHAYDQPLNDKERIITVEACGREFTTAAWMAQQVNEFTQLVPIMLGLGCMITVHGDGLLPYVASRMETSPIMPLTAADERASAIFDKIKDMKNPVGVEIGVFTGELSRRLLKRDDLKLYMIDSWQEHGGDSEYAKSGDFHGSLSQSDQDRFFEHTKRMTMFAGERAKVIKKDSLSAANDFPDNSLDFVFLDADHTYEAVKADIAAWFPKVRDGGYLSGHDYENNEYPAWGVKKAVDELGLTIEKGGNFTWFIQLAKTVNKDIIFSMEKKA